MIKAAFFDVDGTLYSHESKGIPESARKALDALREKGILVFLATGRNFEEVDKLRVGELAFDGYVMLNGQLCTDGERRLIFGSTIEGSDAQYLLDAFESREFPVVLVEEDRMYINFVDETVCKAQEAISSELPRVQEYEGAPLYQIVCYGGKERERMLKEKLSGCKITRWCPYGMDVISKNGGKVTGIQKMLELFHIAQEEVIAFGDGENDIEMLKFAGIGVAMGNADDEVKAAADYVTTDIDEDGICNALKYWKIL